ncbi:probable cytochrome P450 6a13 [Aricia agestis]|uniref:probable cytochrome P450 6a13 n=1 Tax=Aricia agestis TaxID=91739 RepID=UPI001C206FE5|nr:probable cytochrome P450 6a13 [Aricia agestis]
MTLGVILLVILISLLLLLTAFHYATSGRKYWLNRRVPYKEPCPIFGNFGATFIMRRSYTRMLQIFYDSFRDEKYVGIYQARRPALMLIDLELVKTIMSSEFPSFGDRISVSTDTKREPLLRNLANMSGAEWKTMRHIVTPTFSSAKMKAMFPLIAECTKSLKNALDRENGEDIDVPKLMTRYTTDVLGSCAFGVDPGSLKDERSPFLIMSQKMFKTDRATILKRYCRAFFPRLFKLLNLKTYSPEVEYFFSTTIKQVLDERRSTGKERSDFLQLMLNVQKNENGFAMTDELIVSNSFIFMLAGLETTATTMSFCLYHLAKDQELQERIRSEVKECLERYNGMTYEAVCAMRLVIAVFYETLRMHPPTPLTTRLCTAPCTIPGTELSAKPRDAYLIPIHCIQKDATYFPDPDKFDPERFSDDLNQNGFLAFGEGPRSCPGARFAQLMFTAGLATILQHYAVEPCERTTPTIEYDTRSVMLKNKGGIWLKYRAHSESK